MTISGEQAKPADAARPAGHRPLDDLVDVLWDERTLLRRLQLKLVTVSLLIRAGEWEWISDIDRGLLATSERLKRTEVVRAATSARLALDVGLDADASLSALGTALGEPWTSVLLDHDHALRALSVAVDDAAVAAERWLTATEGFDLIDLQERFPLPAGVAHRHSAGAGEQ